MTIPEWLEIDEEMVKWLDAQSYESPEDPRNCIKADFAPSFDEHDLKNLQVIVTLASYEPTPATRGGVQQFVGGPPATRGQRKTRREVNPLTALAIRVLKKVDCYSDIKNLAWLTSELITYAYQWDGSPKVVRVEWDEMFDLDTYEKHNAYETIPILYLR